MTSDEAIVEISERSSTWKLGIGRDRRVDAFVKALEKRFPELGTPRSDLPIEFDVHRDWLFMGIGWSYVTEFVEAIAPIAFAEGLALYDPQRELVAMPQPFADAPMGTTGIAAHERIAERAIDALVTAAGLPGDVVANANDVARRAGFVTMSPLGFEITPDVEAEV